MDFKFSKDSGDSQQESSGEKKKQSTLLVLLLVLVGGFTYLYFFTGLIKPQVAQKPAEAPAAAPQVEKMPLPPREGEPAKPAATAPVKAEAPKTAATAPVTAAAPGAAQVTPSVKPAPAPAAKPAPAPAAKPAPAPAAKPAPAPATKPAPAPATKPAPAPAAKPAPAPAAKAAPAKPADKKTASGDKTKPGTAVKAKNGTTDSWMLLVGNYVLEESLSADMGRVRKAGFEPVVKPSAHKRTSMNRLFVADFNDRPSAQSTLEKLKRVTSDGFIIEQGGKFSVYAGSYLQIESANSEKDRLKASGFSATIKHSSIAIPSQRLSVGPFKSKKSADAALAKLKGAGIKATFVQK